MFDPIRYLGWAGIAAGYNPIDYLVPIAGENGQLRYAARLVCINNLTNADLMFSLNGVDDHFMVTAETGKVYDITSNTFNTNLTGIFAFAIGTRFYVKQLEVPTTKGVYIEVIYGSEHV